MISRNIDCTIERRLLVSYRIDPERVAGLVPQPLRPHVVNGYAVGGVCFLRMSALRPDSKKGERRFLTRLKAGVSTPRSS